MTVFLKKGSKYICSHHKKQRTSLLFGAFWRVMGRIDRPENFLSLKMDFF